MLKMLCLWVITVVVFYCCSTIITISDLTMHTGNIAEINTENGIFSIIGHAVSMTFDLWIQNLSSSSVSQDALLNY